MTEPIVEPWVVPGSEDLPEEVKNGEIPEDDGSTTERIPDMEG